MKGKILGIIIGLMLMFTFFATAQNVENNSIHSIKNNPYRPIFDDDVPVWEVGDQWTYRIHDIDVDFDEDNQSLQIHLEAEDLLLQVISDSGDSYGLEFTGEISGTLDADFDFGDGPVRINVTLESTPVSGDIVIEKTNLGIEEINAVIEGRVIVNVFEQPYVELPFNIPAIPIRGEIDFNINFGTSFAILDFPLNTSKIWNLSATNLTVGGEIRSIWLNIINFVNKIATLFGFELLPEEIAGLLPVIDIQEALEVLGIGNSFEIPEIPYAFACFGRDNITVEAGTFDAYNISIAGGLANCYYAPEAGNVIRIQGNLQDLLPYVTDINMELIETNYE